MRIPTGTELRKQDYPAYAKRIERIQTAETELLFSLGKVTPWQTAEITDQRTFLQLCHASPSVTMIMIGKAAFPSEPRGFFCRNNNPYDLARQQIHPGPFRVKIGEIEDQDTHIYFSRPRMINRSAWHRSEPRGEMSQLCGLFGYEKFGFIDPREEEEMWFKHAYRGLPFNRITSVTIERTPIMLFEKNLHIVHISTKR